jgi:hypothetical protein
LLSKDTLELLDLKKLKEGVFKTVKLKVKTLNKDEIKEPLIKDNTGDNIEKNNKCGLKITLARADT